MFNFQNVVEFEKRSIFIINFIFVLLVIFSILYHVSLKYFFYFNIIFTLLVSYFFFKKSRRVSKSLIVTNLFIFFYFLYPFLASYFTELFGSKSYIFIIFYNIFIAYIFLSLSGYHKKLLGNFSKFSFPILLVILMIGFVFGLLFNVIKEPVPSLFVDFGDANYIFVFSFLLFSSFIVAFSEQMIFSGFLFNTYSRLTSKYDAFYQTSLIFVLFHILRFETLVKYYFVNFNDWYIFYLVFYYVFLFSFMILALYFYSFKYKKFEGNFMYPVALHFAADFGLFFFYVLGA